MTKTKLLDFKYKSSLKRAAVRKAIIEVYGDDLYSDEEDEEEKQTDEKTGKTRKTSNSLKKG